MADVKALRYESIKVDLDNHVAIVSLDRAPLNAFNGIMKNDLIDVYGRLDADDRVKVIILTATQHKAPVFCAGADLTGSGNAFGITAPGEGQPLSSVTKDHRDGGGHVALAVHRMRKPTICAINGHAIGVGITMTLPFDIRIAWRDAQIGFIFAQRGITPEAASSFFLPRLVGHSRTLDLFLRARVLPASDPAYDLLFSELVNRREDVLPRALAVAREMCARNSAVSMAVIKSMVWHGYPTAEEQHILDSEAIATLGNTADGKEGVASFIQKRPANFQGTIPKDMPIRPWWTQCDIRGPVELRDSKFKL